MSKALFLAISIAIASVTPALAQAWLDQADNGQTRGNMTYATGSSAAMQAGLGYEAQNPRQDQSGNNWTDLGFGQRTKKGDSVLRGNNKGFFPDSATVTGAPVLGSFFAPSNLALQTQYKSPIGGMLPQTRLDSFVRKAENKGVAEFIYGDEGTTGPPPYDFFLEINTGIESGRLSTGHKSDAPSAWGTPLKYNSQGGVIQGE